MSSTRADITIRRTYNRPVTHDPLVFETWDETIARVIRHQAWLWSRAMGRNLNRSEREELEALGAVMGAKKASVAGRTLWLGGTGISQTRESCNFNCSFLQVRTVYDIVDTLWLLLQGCGVGFSPVGGILNGFMVRVDDIQIIRSERTFKGGNQNNCETWISDSKTWVLQVGDSAEAWAKAIGKIIAGKYPAKKIILDLSQIRPAGERLKGYGWISSGDYQLAKALVGICKVMNEKAGQLLNVIDILDIINWLGTVLSSRRSAELALLSTRNPMWQEFAAAKKDHYKNGNIHRGMSNNTVMFWEKPSRGMFQELFDTMVDNGGNDPGLLNADHAYRRAPWFVGVNPCGEILLGDKSFCNLCDTALPRYNRNFSQLLKDMWLLARANYRQTCVNLDDGVLQRSWHELNEFLHLTGMGLTGYVQWESQNDPAKLQALRANAQSGAHSMADELGLPRSKAVTTIKPSGTIAKCFDVTEGGHMPLGKYIFNWIGFNQHDPIVKMMEDANYEVMVNPSDSSGRLVKFPVQYNNIKGFTEVNGTMVNQESAITQLERYRCLMNNYVDHNASITVSYDPSEVPEIVNYFDKHWDEIVGVSFLFRNDPTKTADDLGAPYLPQEVVDERRYFDYKNQLKHVSIDDANSQEELESDECVAGVCPAR